MKKSNSASLMLVAVTIIAIAGAILLAWPGIKAWASTRSPNLHVGALGVTEVQCIDGFKFVAGSLGRTTQMLDEKGGGVPCR